MKAVMVLILLVLPLHAATGGAGGPVWMEHEPLRAIERSTVSHGGHRLDVLVRREGKERRPVLVLVSGSVCMPVFMATKKGAETDLMTGAVLPRPATQSEMGVHLAILERRNIVSLERYFDPADTSPQRQLELNPCTDTHGGATLEQRVADTLAQIAHLRRQPWAGRILLAGMSEGADVAAAVAADPSAGVHALLLMSGAGMSQFFDMAHASRAAGNRAGAAKAFADLDAFLRDAPPEPYLGYPSRRWRTFAIDTTPLDSLLASDVPVFVVHGGRDTSVPIASVDAVVVELARKQPGRAIFYWAIETAEHGLEVGDMRPGEMIYPEFVRWAGSSPGGRTFRQ